MCSTPKGQHHLKPRKQTSNIMMKLTAEQYAEMVRCSNEAYERRQKRKKERSRQLNSKVQEADLKKTDQDKTEYWDAGCLWRIIQRMLARI